MDLVDWGEPVALYDDRMQGPIAEGSLLTLARQAIATSPALRAHLRIESLALGSLDEFAICALVTAPGFIDHIPFRAAA